MTIDANWLVFWRKAKQTDVSFSHTDGTAAAELGSKRSREAFQGEPRASKDYLDLVAKSGDLSLVAGRAWSLAFAQASLSYSPDGVVARYINPEEVAGHLVYADSDDWSVVRVKSC